MPVTAGVGAVVNEEAVAVEGALTAEVEAYPSFFAVTVTVIAAPTSDAVSM
jgi:hypothetical protein